MAQNLTKDLVPDPSRHRLQMLVGPRGLDVTVFAPAEDNSLIYRHIGLDPAAKSPQDALENAVYDNPLLLGRFRRVDCLVDTPRMLMLPAGRVAEAPDMLAELYGEDEFETMCDTLDGAGATLAFAAPRRLVGFMKRTFGTPRISHRLSPLCRYYAHRTRFGNVARMHIHLHGDACDIVTVACDTIITANTFAISAVSDAVYFALAVARSVDFDPEADRVLVSGDPAPREELMAVLRRNVRFVMPLIFPSDMLRIGPAAMDAPFPMIANTLID